MSRQHATIAHEINHLLHELHTMAPEEIESFYGIEFRKGGIIYDPTYSLEFGTLGEWASFSVEQDFEENHEDFHPFGDYDE